jgi:RNA polymerase sigma-70 factor (ECF subfamily)
VEDYSHITDHELLERYYENHENRYMGALLERYTLLLFGVCMKYLKNEEEARDAVQQVFVKVITELKKYRVAYFKSWIYMVARNYCLMKLRQNGNRTLEIDERRIPEEEYRQNVLVEKEILLEAMNASLPELSPEQELCVTLFYLENKSYQEIVEKTGFTIMQVKSHIQNGKRNLRILMDRKLNLMHKNEK